MKTEKEQVAGSEQEWPSVIPEHIPVHLKEREQWVCWRYEEVPGRNKPAKAPFDPVTGLRIDVTQSDTLRLFEVVYENYTHSGGYDGIGFALMPDDGVVGVDLDAVVDTGVLSPLASDVIALLDSYSEISPSGQGVRIFVSADLGEFAGRRKGSVELYNYNRYLTVTGHHINGTPETLTPRLEQLRELYRRYLLPEQEIQAKEHFLPPTASDEEVLARMFAGKLGSLYEQIYHGDLSGVYGQSEDGRPDQSRADTLLINGLAFYTRGDAAQMRRILLFSPRAQQRLGKWAKRVQGATTYLEYQIDDSIGHSRKKVKERG